MHFLLSGIILSSSRADAFPPDDIDRLFDKLQTLEPPGDLLKRIFTRLDSSQPSAAPPQEEQPAEKPQRKTDN